MTRTPRAASWSVAILLASSLAQAAGAQFFIESADRQRLEQAARAITELRIEEAEQLLDALDPSLADAPNRLHELARLRFHQGRYAEALSLAERALSGAPDNKITRRFRALHDLIVSTHEVTRDFHSESSADGRYVVLYPEGKDRHLAGYALHVLAEADRALEQSFGLRIPGPIRLEIYPSPDLLARVSALTTEQIETTGTVALSKWNRLMITSPKALVRGYPWADTITHELVHLVLSRLTADNAPVWLQEGTAKLFERSWRGPHAGLALDPASRALLHGAKARSELLTFEQMHPSIAMLPSQDAAALAFAQVATFMERYLERYGRAALQAALGEIRDGVDAREALGTAAGVAFGKLEQEWKASIPSDKHADEHAARRLKKRFVVGDGPTDEAEDVVEAEARRYMRIADLLWDRGRTRAAAIEYKKAHEADRDDPIVAARWARAALQSGDPQGAVAALSLHAERYAGHAPTHSVLGQALLQAGDKARARTELREAIWVNPFDPEPHCALASAAESPEEARREQALCDALR